MNKNDLKVFISYTLRDGIVRRTFLLNLEKYIKQWCKPFIDLLHNDSVDRQSRVYMELLNSDFLLLIKTNETFKSEWVRREISMANKMKIPIIKFEYEQLIEKLT